MNRHGMNFTNVGNKLGTEGMNDLPGDQHGSISNGIALGNDAFPIPDEEKIRIIASHFREILTTLGLDVNDDSLKGTAQRIAKMYVKEIFSGLNPQNKPVVRLIANEQGYNQMLVEKNISLYSSCAQHFVPIVGKVHVGYISPGKVIGPLGVNRIVQYLSRRPQIQEILTLQVANELKTILGTESVAVLIEAVRFCVSSGGMQDINNSSITTHFSGKFKQEDARNEFLALIK